VQRIRTRSSDGGTRVAAAAGVGDGAAPVDDERVRAGHALRRLGFGPSPRDMRHVLRIGVEAWIEEQLDPQSVEDTIAEARYRPEPTRYADLPLSWLYRWCTRMVHSRRQLREKMALLWHEHFATSVGKVNYFTMMHDQEELFRQHGLGSFRDLLIGISRDNAMLIYLDNTGNDGQAVGDDGERTAPNENYARELMQLFALGPVQLEMNGAPVVSADGVPLPAFGERDVKEAARALTGWFAKSNATFLGEPPNRTNPPAEFDPSKHDPGSKAVLGEVIPAAAGDDGAADIERLVDILMRQPTMAPFIASELIQKLATETPTPGYVERVATVFASTDGDIAETVRAIATDPEFFSDAVVRSQYREPIEQVVGAVRALEGRTDGVQIHAWAAKAGQSLWFPPSVFSFYRPGAKRSLIEAGLVPERDQAADELARADLDDPSGTGWDARRFMRHHGLRRHPERAVDALAETLLAAPLRAAVRDEIAAYLGTDITTEKLRGAAWLLMTTPEFQVN
jgi:uncharacterized protein (DUF1800 family)